MTASTLALAACGGGGGGGGDAAPAPAPGTGTPGTGGSALTLADCLRDPSGVTSTYLNSTRPRREWKAATFPNETGVVGRFEYADATTTSPSRIVYYKFDTAARTVTTVGQDDIVNGTLRRVQYVGLVNSTALAAGQSEAKTYTVRTLAPAGLADTTERLTVAYEANESVTLPDASATVTGLGRLDTCRVRQTLESVSGTTATQVSVETLHFAPGLGFVKSYYKPTLASFADRNQTYLTELVSTSGALTLQASNADGSSSLSVCSAVPAGQNLEFTASDAADASSAFRRTGQSNFNNGQGSAPAIAVERLRALNQTRARIDYLDPQVGYLRPVGIENFNGDGTVLAQRFSRTGRPDLRSAPVGVPQSFTETIALVPAGNSTPVVSNDQFRFDGFAKVTTPAGTFDTCKVTFTYGVGETASETYYHAPNLHWVRLDYTLRDGTRATREMVAKTP